MDGGNAGGKVEGEEIPFPPAPQYIGARDKDPRFQGIASARGYSQEQQRIQKMRYSHEALVDLMIAEPTLTQNQLASKFGYSHQWISRIIGSDAFQAYLASRRSEITDPFLVASIEEQLRGLATQSIDVITQKLQSTQNVDVAIKGLEIASKALGFGARDRGPQINNNFVVALPSKVEDSTQWAQKYGGGATIEAQPVQSMKSTAVRNPLQQPKSMTPAEE